MTNESLVSSVSFINIGSSVSLFISMKGNTGNSINK